MKNIHWKASKDPNAAQKARESNEFIHKVMDEAGVFKQKPGCDVHLIGVGGKCETCGRVFKGQTS